MRKLIVKGTEIAAVNITSGESAPEKYAAAELAKYLDKIAGITTGGGYPITVKIDDRLHRDGYRISICDTTGLYILGGNGRGVIYGVYAFLEKYAGVRFFIPGLEVYGSGDIIVDEGFSHTPVIDFRQSDWMCGRDVEWRVKNGINDRVIPEEMGGYIKMADGAGVHTMETLTGADQYREQPCLSDPENLAKAIKKVREILDSDPDATIISVSQNDNRNFCTCDKCKAVDDEEGSHMGTLLRFVNAVADDIREDFPHVTVDTLAYQYTRQAPKLTVPRDNVCIRLCSIECCFSHPLNDPTCTENVHFCSDIVEWNKLSDNIYIWDYVTNFLYYIAPFPNFGVLRENMRFFADHGVKGMYPEGNFNSPQSGEFGELRCYLLAKLMMDPYMSTTDYYGYMDEFLAAYYGDGWRYIRAFIDFTTMETAGRHMRIYDHPFSIIPRDRYEAMEDIIDTWWDKAEELAGDRLDSVKRSRMQWRYIKLMLHPSEEEGQAFIDDVKKYRIRWCENKDFPNDVDFSKTPDLWQNWKK
ncbi:MAG: DUF4838 domain-containing protein [Ruminococcaceae bacterium]|nr:DUF4838 domain-containing protein [Oscillospiraceae bacterium]